MPAIQTGLFLEGTVQVPPLDPNQSIIGDEEAGDEGGYDTDEDVPYENPQTGECSYKHQQSLAVENGDSTKHVHFLEDGDADAPDKNKRDQAAINARLIALKKSGYRDAYVVNKLKEEGLADLKPTGVAHKWRLLRVDEERKEDEALDDELSDWHVGEDDNLRESCSAAEAKFNKELEKLNEKKWKDVSENLAKRLDQKKYTPKACKERWEALQDGTALLPIELDPDQEGRARMREERIAENKRVRKEAVEAKKRAEEEKQRKICEQQWEKEQNALAKQEHKESRIAEKEETKRMKLERKSGKEAERARREEGLQRLRDEANEKKETKEIEERVYRYYTGKDLTRKHNKNRDDDEYDSDEEDFMHDLEDSDEDEARVDDDESMILKVIETKKPKSTVKPAKITPATLLNPRSVMTMHELEILLVSRELPRRANKETHPHVVARLAAVDATLSSADLNTLLEKSFISRKGNKATRVLRLQENDAVESTAGQKGVKSTDLEFKKGYEGYRGGYASLIDED